jgi:hypothetical protein
MKKYFLFLTRGIQRIVEHILTMISLTIVYVFGIGSSWIVAKLTGKHFLDSNFSSRSSWKTYSTGENPERMF